MEIGFDTFLTGTARCARTNRYPSVFAKRWTESRLEHVFGYCRKRSVRKAWYRQCLAAVVHRAAHTIHWKCCRRTRMHQPLGIRGSVSPWLQTMSALLCTHTLISHTYSYYGKNIAYYFHAFNVNRTESSEHTFGMSNWCFYWWNKG